MMVLLLDDNELPFCTNLYFCRILTRASLIYIRAMCWPMQFLGPLENGMKVIGFSTGLLNL